VARCRSVAALLGDGDPPAVFTGLGTVSGTPAFLTQALFSWLHQLGTDGLVGSCWSDIETSAGTGVMGPALCVERYPHLLTARCFSSLATIIATSTSAGVLDLTR
jgi:hypothetical protein